MSKINIKNLRLRCILGIFDFERTNKQDIILNYEIDFDGTKAAQSDHINDTVDYKKINKAIIEHVEASSCYLIEKLCDECLNIIMTDERIQKSSLCIEKPAALRFTDGVSVTMEKSR
jgi:D-erythro-7,8-dihydroneopterin triphosphate epimerase